MKSVTQQEFNELVEHSTLKPRIKRELRFVSSTAGVDWQHRDYVPVSDRSGNKGVLLLTKDSDYYLLPYEIKRGLSSSFTGAAQPIICDLCRTWQSGTRAGSITFSLPHKKGTVSHLCCADLLCSSHVRGTTSASKTSRSQLREHIAPEERVERLQNRLSRLIDDLNIQAILIP